MSEQANVQNGIPRFLRDSERQDMMGDLGQLESLERAQKMNGADPAHIQTVKRAHKRMIDSIEAQTPPDINKAEEDRLHKRIVEHRKILAKGIPSSETMRRNPIGAADRHIAWENRVEGGMRNKDRVRMMRADVQTFMKGAPVEDVSPLLSVESLRPLTEPGNFEGPDVQIPRTRTWVQLPGDGPDRHPKAIDWDSFRESSPAYAAAQLEAERQAAEKSAAEKDAVIAALRIEADRARSELDQERRRASGVKQAAR